MASSFKVLNCEDERLLALFGKDKKGRIVFVTFCESDIYIDIKNNFVYREKGTGIKPELLSSRFRYKEKNDKEEED
jgi:hypothetical protein